MRGIALAIVLVTMTAAHLVVAANVRSVLAWMCLERSGEKVADDLALNDAFVQRGDLQINSPVYYELSSDASLVWARGNSNVTAHLLASGVAIAPAIGSTSIADMRRLFASPDRFINAAIAEADAHQYRGYNIDFEPEGDNVTVADGVAFTAFLDAFARRLHRRSHPVRVSVDVANWQPNLWNYSALADTALDTIITMDTYTNVTADFVSNLTSSMDAIVGNDTGTRGAQRLAKLAIGLDGEYVYSAAVLDAMFAALDANLPHCAQLDVWSLPLTAHHAPIVWDYVHRWVHATPPPLPSRDEGAIEEKDPLDE